VLHHWKPAVVGAAAASTALLGLIWPSAAQATPAASCTANAGNTGLSASIVAHPGQRITHRMVDATGCDIGIFIGRGVEHVTVDAVTVTDANFQGILAIDTSHVTVVNSRIDGNGFNTIDNSAPPLPGSGVHSYVSQAFGISLFGVSDSTVAHNAVFNNGRGGIGIMDNGPNNPGAITQDESAPLMGSSHDVVVGNQIWSNYNGCALVVATQNFGGWLSHLVLAGNTIHGTGLSPTMGPDIGGIVVAADPPNSSVRNVRVLANRVTDSFEGGVIVNAEAFNSFTRNVLVAGNRVSGNNWGAQEAPKTAGVIVFADPGAAVPPGARAPRNLFTFVAGNRISDQFYGIYSIGDYAPLTFGNRISVTSGGVPVYHG
jgi:hypothetical protein